MADENNDLTREQADRLLKQVMERHKIHQEEKRRVLELNSGFFEKLAALNAGSIALAATIALAVRFKSDLPYAAALPVIHQILTVVILLWFSFALSVLHNFLGAVVFARLEKAYATTDYVIEIGKASLATVKERVALEDATAVQVEDAFFEVFRPKRQRLAKGMDWLDPVIPYVGYAAMLAFVAAYSFVALYLFKLW